MSFDEGSTFAGKSTEDTIENYAEVMLDNIKRGMLAEAIKAWEKAKEIDIRMTNKIFEGPYSSKIAHAYATHVRKKLIVPLEEEMLSSLRKRDENPMIDVAVVRIAGIEAIHDEAQIAFSNAEAFNSSEYEIWIAKAEFYLSYLGPPMPFTHMDGTISHNEHWIEEEFYMRREEGIKAAHTALQLAPSDPTAIEVMQKLNQRVSRDYIPSSCFIATAAYGTPFNEDIDVLRTWRDKFLLNSFGGKIFVKNYYRYSPPIANLISESRIAKKIVRKTLKPVVKILENDYS